MIYILLAEIVIIAMIFSAVAKKEIAECKTEEESRTVRAKWQLIFGMIGAAMILVVGIYIFLM